MNLAIALSEIPETGVEKSFTDPAIWQDPIEEFNIPCKVEKPLSAKVFMLKTKEGCLLKGEIEGSIALACDRCGELAIYPIEINFEEFEQMPKDYYSDDEDADTDDIEKSLIFSDTKGILHIDVGSLLWEELALSLPVKPLCSENCAGVCTKCGVNKNKETCSCDETVLDHRFAKLQGLKINKK